MTSSLPHDLPLDSPGWDWAGVRPIPAQHHGRRCLTFTDVEGRVAALSDVQLTDGAIEIDMAVTRDRAFPGVVWRVQDDDNYEAFWVRPHQVGNPDSIQYSPLFNGVDGWQLYHGEGFNAAVDFPIDEWFTVRVVFAGSRAEVFVGDLQTPALVVGELKRGEAGGRVGIFVGGEGMYVSGFRYDPGPVAFRAPAPPPPAPVHGVVPAWEVSDPFAEEGLTAAATLDPARLAAHHWTRLTAEPSGLADLARVNPLIAPRDTVFARATLRSARAQDKVLELGFSDRAVVYLNGRAIFRGDDSYRSRDYRFLGSIGWWDALFLPLVAGDNALVVAVSESFGGWGLKARLTDPDGVEFR